MCNQTAADIELEQAVRATVWALADSIPKGCRMTKLAVELVETMDAPSDAHKISALATSYVAALKMISELVPEAPDGVANS